MYQNEDLLDGREIPVVPPVVKKEKRFAIIPAPFDNVMTYEEAKALADKQILDGKAKQMYVLEIVGVIEPITRMVEFTEKGE